MRFELASRTALAYLSVAVGLAVSEAALGEPDVLERPAPMRSAERAATSVLLNVKMAGNRLVAIGERGLILWSDNDGQSWKQASVPVSVTLTSVSFADATHGWATGHSGVILRSSDGGQTWTKVLDGTRAASLLADESGKPGASEALIADAKRLVADGPDKPFLDVKFWDAKHGLVVGAYGLLYGTDDGGDIWKPLQGHIDNPKGAHLYALHDTGDTLYLSGEQGVVFVSQDRGKNFAALKTPYVGTYFGILTAGSNLIAFGMRGNAYWSGDGGQSWTKSEVPEKNTLTAGTHARDGAIFLVDDAGHVLVSRDDGKRFISANLPKQTPLNAVVETPSGKLCLAGARGISCPNQRQSGAERTK